MVVIRLSDIVAITFFFSFSYSCFNWCLGLALLIWAHLGNMALLVAGKTAPFCALSFDVFRGLCCHCSASGLLTPVVVAGLISTSIHGIWIEGWHLDSQDSGPLLWRESCGVLLLWGECPLLVCRFFVYSLDVLDRSIVLMVLPSSVLPFMEVEGSGDFVDVVHHLEREFGCE